MGSIASSYNAKERMGIGKRGNGRLPEGGNQMCQKDPTFWALFPTPCHPERSRCFANAKQLRSRGSLYQEENPSAAHVR